MSIHRSIYGGQGVIHECELTASELDEIISRSSMSEKIKQEIKLEPEPDPHETTNIIVTKYEDPASDVLDVEPTLELDSKGKLIQVELLPSSHLRNIQNKDVASLLNKTVSKKITKRKLEGTENKKVSDGEVKKKKIKHCSTCHKEYVKNHDLVCPLNSDDAKPLHPLGGALCSKCGKNFSSNYNLKRHMTSCKLCPDEEKGPRFVCQCGRTYSQEWDMKKHKIKCKEGKKKCKQCLVANCNLLFYHKAQLITHMKRDHSVLIQDPEVLSFNTFEDFLTWKEKEEETTYTYYSKQTGSNVTGVSVNTYYVCQHDGSDRTHSSSPRKTDRRNKKGRIKTGRLCWSQMNVKQFKDGTVRVTYFPSHTHVVSAADTEHHPLPSSISMEIKKRLSQVKVELTDEATVDENLELKKMVGTKKKRYGMTMRALRSLARKNRDLFRITDDAVQDTDTEGQKPLIQDGKSGVVFPTQSLIREDGNMLQVFVTDQEQEENVDDPEEVHVTVEANGTGKSEGDDLSRAVCSQLDLLKGLVESGKIQTPQLAELQLALKSLVGNFQVSSTTEPTMTNLEEVMYQQPGSPLQATQTFPLQDTVNVAGIELSEELKSMEQAPDKTIYQIVALNKDKTSATDNAEFLYQNAVELVGAREFIIIAGDHTQFFQSVESNTTFDMTS